VVNALLAFPRDLLALPPVWRAWLGVMLLLNAIAPLFYFGTVEGLVVFGTFLISAGLMMAIHRARGFVRLIGIAHFVWFPMLGWLATRVGDADGAMFAWLVALIAVNGISLAIDIVDLIRYLRGEREVTLHRPS
jgi:hypothetical protein